MEKLETAFEKTIQQNAQDRYETPLAGRYASAEMCYNFSERRKTITWRMLWLNLARAQKRLGFDIRDEQISEIERAIENINFAQVRKEEARTRHDVMAHLACFAALCPTAAPILHLGATSCFVTDNADLISIRDGLDILTKKILRVIQLLANFCDAYKALPTLGYTHLQPAQLTTVGKRGCLWLSDLVTDYHNLVEKRKGLKFRGVKGAVGTQASFLSLFNGDFEKVKQLDDLVTKMSGFEKKFEVTGQTYSRKADVEIIMVLASLGSSVHKICTDIRLLEGFQEITEPFAKESQIGSSAMPYKQNPIRSERCCGLARHLSSLCVSILQTHSVQWLERSLDDSANRRIVIPEAFLIADTLLETLIYIFKDLVVFPKVIQKRIKHELPFLAVEKIMIEMVKNGANRNECHEKLRILAIEAANRMKLNDESCNVFMDSIIKDDYFKPIYSILENLLDPNELCGFAKEQTIEFLKNVVEPILEKSSAEISKIESNVTI